jgi:hypothetical protein
MQRRSFPRLRISSDARILTRNGSFPGMLENISLSGLYVRVAGKVELGDSSEITILLPAVSRQESLQIRGVAVRVDTDGIAFRFGTIDHATFDHLKSILKNKGVRKLAA